MTLYELQQILANVVKNVPSTESPATRPNTFVVLGQRSDLEAANFQKTVQSALQGTLYIRNYDAARHNIDAMVAQYPCVWMEATDGGGTLTEARWRIKVACVDELRQTPTAANNRNTEAVERDTEYILYNVMRQAQQYRKFETAPSSGLFVWGIESEILTEYPTALGGEYASSYITNSLRFERFRPRTNKDDIIGTAFNFDVNLKVPCAHWVNS